MNEIMINLFKEYNFIKLWEDNNRIFFTNTNKNVVSYFILNFIDCSDISDDDNYLREELSKLEEEYIDSSNDKSGIKYSIIDSFEDKQEVAQIDKNTSAIYLVKFSEINMLAKYRNLIYSIEESPNYFKRYILPYTEKQVVGLNKVLSDYKDRNIVEILTDLADDEENYYSLMNAKNSNSIYELVIRLFSKVPFLQYKFRAKSDEISLEKMVNDALDDNLKIYDQAIIKNKIDIEELISQEEDDISEKEVDKILSKLLEESE
ncbi:MAG: hypothetical protein HFG59_01540 [Lachnospiraceae bacterium]|nr:hypothetical protein [Lachnospiraceae bacterium]